MRKSDILISLDPNHMPTLELGMGLTLQKQHGLKLKRDSIPNGYSVFIPKIEEANAGNRYLLHWSIN